MNNLATCCADVGSVKGGNFGWCGLRPGTKPVLGVEIEQFAEFIAASLRDGIKVAVGFECPLFVPVRDEPLRLAMARSGEGNRSWSAAAGCGVLATGLVEVIWTLSHVKKILGAAPTPFLDWQKFITSESGVFFWA